MSFSSAWLQNLQRFCALPANQRILLHPHIPKTLHEVNNKRKAAVLIPLCNRHGQASILFTVRTQTVSTHKGQVSFPGGHVDPNETAIEAAIRETREELGDGIGNIQVIGVAQTIPAITGTLVTPVLAYVETDLQDLQHLTPSPGEVDVIFTRTLSELTDPAYRTMQELERQGVKYKMPVYGEQSEHRIWGLTAMILDPILHNVVMPNMPK